MVLLALPISPSAPACPRASEMGRGGEERGWDGMGWEFTEWLRLEGMCVVQPSCFKQGC